MKPKIHRLTLDDTFENEFELYALQTVEDDYRLAYLLNIHLGLHFKKKNPIQILKTDEKYNYFIFKDATHYRNWYLLQNFSFIESKQSITTGLFGDTTLITEKKVLFFKELAKTNFILKIEAEEDHLYFENLLKTITKIPEIQLVKRIDPDLLNAKRLMLM